MLTRQEVCEGRVLVNHPALRRGGGHSRALSRGDRQKAEQQAATDCPLSLSLRPTSYCIIIRCRRACGKASAGPTACDPAPSRFSKSWDAKVARNPCGPTISSQFLS